MGCFSGIGGSVGDFLNGSTPLNSFLSLGLSDIFQGEQLGHSLFTKMDDLNGSTGNGWNNPFTGQEQGYNASAGNLISAIATLWSAPYVAAGAGAALGVGEGAAVAGAGEASAVGLGSAAEIGAGEGSAIMAGEAGGYGVGSGALSGSTALETGIMSDLGYGGAYTGLTESAADIYGLGSGSMLSGEAAGVGAGAIGESLAPVSWAAVNGPAGMGAFELGASAAPVFGAEAAAATGGAGAGLFGSALSLGKSALPYLMLAGSALNAFGNKSNADQNNENLDRYMQDYNAAQQSYRDNAAWTDARKADLTSGISEAVGNLYNKKLKKDENTVAGRLSELGKSGGAAGKAGYRLGMDSRSAKAAAITDALLKSGSYTPPGLTTGYQGYANPTLGAYNQVNPWGKTMNDASGTLGNLSNYYLMQQLFGK